MLLACVINTNCFIYLSFFLKKEGVFPQYKDVTTNKIFCQSIEHEACQFKKNNYVQIIDESPIKSEDSVKNKLLIYQLIIINKNILLNVIFLVDKMLPLMEYIVDLQIKPVKKQILQLLKIPPVQRQDLQIILYCEQVSVDDQQLQIRKKLCAFPESTDEFS
ncbi:unnamed protein product [Paramecium sonneborni]|uniref:Uncharacterized protein n=1 Tax=Paramecium sonneborni TaxID=65129 RepID=A0A8S1Q6Y3_9CILI|nr:unnamed protein product [Paramecium sonneborni]